MDILNVDDLAALLKMSKAQVYELTKVRTRSGAMRNSPIPFLKINGNVRFRRIDIEEWLGTLVEGKTT